MMNKNIFISKKKYVAPLVTFEEMEEEQELLVTSPITESTGQHMGNGDGTDDLNPDLPSKMSGGSYDAEGDFVFEIDGMEQ